jgi:hypothetical protein
MLRGSITAKDGSSDTRIVTNILVCDLAREEELGIGRGWAHRSLGEGEAHVTASVLSSLGLRGRRGDRARVDIGFGKLLATAGATPALLEQLLQSSVLRDGITVHLNGTFIAEQLAARGLPLPPNLLPPTIDTRVPIAQIVDVRALLATTVAQVATNTALRCYLITLSKLYHIVFRNPWCWTSNACCCFGVIAFLLPVRFRAVPAPSFMLCFVFAQLSVCFPCDCGACSILRARAARHPRRHGPRPRRGRRHRGHRREVAPGPRPSPACNDGIITL